MLRFSVPESVVRLRFTTKLRDVHNEYGKIIDGILVPPVKKPSKKHSLSIQISSSDEENANILAGSSISDTE